MNQASHYIDMIEWLIGPAESVCAYTGTLARSIEAEDTAAPVSGSETERWARST